MSAASKATAQEVECQGIFGTGLVQVWRVSVHLPSNQSGWPGSQSDSRHGAYGFDPLVFYRMRYGSSGFAGKNDCYDAGNESKQK